MRVNVRGDTAAAIRDIQYNVPGIVKKSQVTALNKTNAKVATRFRRSLSRRTGIKQKHLKRQIKVYRATWRKATARTFAGLRKKLRLIDISNVPTGKYDDLARGTLHGQSGADSFRAKVKAGRGFSQGFFVRKGSSASASGKDSKGRSKKGRLPIEQVRIALWKVAPGALSEAIAEVGPDEFRKQLNYDLKRRLKRTVSARRSRARRTSSRRR